MSMTRRVTGLVDMDIARHVLGCCWAQETGVQNAVDDVAPQCVAGLGFITLTLNPKPGPTSSTSVGRQRYSMYLRPSGASLYRRKLNLKAEVKSSTVHHTSVSSAKFQSVSTWV